MNLPKLKRIKTKENSLTNLIQVKQMIHSKSQAPYGFNRYQMNTIKNKVILTSNVLFNLYECTFKIPSHSSDLFMVEFKFVKIFSDELGTIVNIIKEAIDNANLGNYLLPKFGYIYDDELNTLSMLYLKDDATPLDILKEYKARFLSELKVKEKFIKLETVKKMSELVSSMDEYNKNPNTLKGNRLHLGILHPELIFYSNKKDFLYFDFIFSSIYKQCQGRINTNVHIYFGLFTPIKEIKLSYLDVVQVMILLVYLMSKKFKKVTKKLHKESYNATLNKFSKDYVSYDSTFESIKQNLHSKLVDFISLVLNVDLNKTLTPRKFHEEYEQVLRSTYYSTARCVDCDLKLPTKSIGNIKLSESVTPNISFHNSSLDESKVKEYSRTYHTLVFNKICFEVLCCENHNDVHNCTWLFKKEEASDDAKYLNNLNEITELKNINDLSPHLRIRNILGFYKENIGSKTELITKVFKRVTNEVKRKNNHLDSIFTLIENHIKTKMKEERKLLDAQFKMFVMSRDEKTMIASLDRFNQTMNKFDSLIRKTNIIKFESIINNLRQCSNKYLDYIRKQLILEFSSSCDELTKEIKRGTEKIDKNIHRNFLLEEESNQRFICTVDFPNQILHCVDTTIMDKPKLIKISDQDKFLLGCRWINTKTQLIVTGGTRSNQCFSVKYFNTDTIDKTVVINIHKENKTKKINGVFRPYEELPSMLNERDQHSMVLADSIFVICVGGKNTRTCEYFHLLTKKWKYLPELDLPLFNASLFLQNNQNLFLFFGYEVYNDNVYKLSSNILKLTLYQPGSKWEKVNYVTSGSVNIPTYLPAIVEYDNNLIIIVGGCKDTQEESKDSHFFNFKENKLTYDKPNEWSKGLCFFESNFIKVGREYHLWSSDLLYAKYIP